MKIYLVGEDDYDGTNIYGLYSSKEKSIEALPYFNCKEDDITEFEVDPPNTGEKYEEFYYYNFFKEGDEQHNITRSRPSDIEPISYGLLNGKYGCPYSGTGRTLEEAKENCYKAKNNAHPVWQIFNDGTEFHYADKSAVQIVRHSNYFCAVHEDRNVCIIAIDEYKKTGKVSEFLRFPGK